MNVAPTALILKNGVFMICYGALMITDLQKMAKGQQNYKLIYANL